MASKPKFNFPAVLIRHTKYSGIATFNSPANKIIQENKWLKMVCTISDDCISLRVAQDGQGDTTISRADAYNSVFAKAALKETGFCGWYRITVLPEGMDIRLEDCVVYVKPEKIAEPAEPERPAFVDKFLAEWRPWAEQWNRRVYQPNIQRVETWRANVDEEYRREQERKEREQRFWRYEHPDEIRRRRALANG